MKHTPRVALVFLASVLGTLGLAVTAPQPAAAGVPSCAGYPVEAAIRAAFPPGAQDHALAIAGRESGCQPCAYYPGQNNCAADPGTARGLFQLLGHNDLLHAVCPFLYPSASWSIPECNSWAAALLYSGAGWAPWGG